MKRIFVLLLAGLLAAFSFTACGSTSDEESKTENKAPAAEDNAKESEDAVTDVKESEDNVTTESEMLSQAPVTDEDVVSEEAPEANDGVDVDALKAQVVEAMEGASFEMPAEMVYNDTGIDPASFEQGFWLCEETGVIAENVAFYVANSEEDANAIKDLLNNKLTSMQNQYKDYNEDNYNLTLNAVIGGNGVYVYLVISPNVDAVKDCIEAAI